MTMKNFYSGYKFDCCNNMVGRRKFPFERYVINGTRYITSNVQFLLYVMVSLDTSKLLFFSKLMGKTILLVNSEIRIICRAIILRCKHNSNKVKL